MNLNVFENYVNLCDMLSIKPSWKGLNEYYNHNASRANFKRRIHSTAKINHTHVRNWFRWVSMYRFEHNLKIQVYTCLLF